jgi:hypothetical protein
VAPGTFEKNLGETSFNQPFGNILGGFFLSSWVLLFAFAPGIPEYSRFLATFGVPNPQCSGFFVCDKSEVKNYWRKVKAFLLAKAFLRRCSSIMNTLIKLWGIRFIS